MSDTKEPIECYTCKRYMVIDEVWFVTYGTNVAKYFCSKLCYNVWKGDDEEIEREP